MDGGCNKDGLRSNRTSLGQEFFFLLVLRIGILSLKEQRTHLPLALDIFPLFNCCLTSFFPPLINACLLALLFEFPRCSVNIPGMQ